MSEVVAYRPGQIDAAISTLTSNVNTMRQQTDDLGHAAQTYVQSGSGQFSDQVQQVSNQQRQVQEEMTQTTQQIIQAVEEAKNSNHARDLRSASSIV